MDEQMNQATFLLTPEELAALYVEVAGPEDGAPLADLLPGYQGPDLELVLDVARRGLLAREILRLEADDEPAIHPLVSVAAFAGLLYERRCLIWRQRAGAPVVALEVYVLPGGVYTTHQLTAGGLHEFAVLDSEAATLQIIEDALAPAAGSAGTPMRVQSNALLAALNQAVLGGQESVAATLAAGGLDKDSAHSLAANLGPDAVLLAILAGPQETAASESPDNMTILRGVGGQWRLELDPDGDETTLQPLSGSDVRPLLHRLAFGA